MLATATVLHKEMRLILRSRRAYWLLFVMLAGTAVFFWLYWLGNQNNNLMARRGRFAREMYMIFCMIELMIMGLIAPIMTASALTSERENKTLDLLRCTNLSTLSILTGKWLAAVAYQFMLVVFLAPFLALTFLLGGVGTEEYVFSIVLIGSTILTYAMVGIAVSSRVRKTTTALFLTLFLVVFIAFLAPMGIILFGQVTELYRFNPRPGNAKLYELITVGLSPLMAWVGSAEDLMRGASRGGLLAGLLNPFVRAHMVFQGFLFLAATFVAWRGVSAGLAGAGPRPRQVVDDPQKLRRRRRRFPYYLIDPLRRPQPIGDRQNPAAVKEQRVTVLARLPVLIRIGYLGVLFSAFVVFLATEAFTRDIPQTIAAWSITFVLVFVPILAATGVSKERDEGTFALLATTLLTSGQIIRAKFRAALRFVVGLCVSVTALPLAVQACVAIFGTGQFSMDDVGYLYVIPSLFAFATLYAALGLFCSTLCRRNMTAIILSYILMGLGLLSPLLMFGLVELYPGELQNTDGGSYRVLLNEINHRVLNESWWAALDYFEPRTMTYLSFVGLMWVVRAIGPLLCPYHHLFFASENQGSDQHFYPDWNEWGTVALHTGLVLGLAATFVALAVWRFHRMRRRE